MSTKITEIPVNAPIVQKDGTITIFFRLKWQSLIDTFAQTQTIAAITAEDRTAAVVTETLYTVASAGRYRITWYLRKTVADGVNSAAQVTIGWSDKGVALTFVGANLTLDTISAYQSNTLMVRSDADVDITLAVSYSSNTPNKMTYDILATVEYLT